MRTHSDAMREMDEAETELILSDALLKLRSLRKQTDKEKAHIEADEILCRVLRHLGAEKIADKFGILNQRFWCA